MIWISVLVLVVSLIALWFACKPDEPVKAPDESQTEAMAEVVKIWSIEPHGNADKLGLPGVPIVSLPEQSAGTVLASLAEGPSLVYSPQIREGVVVESVGLTPRVKAKLVGEGYYLRKEA